MTKPMLACDWNEAKVKLPVMMQPKVDGVRVVNLGFGMTGRSTKKFKNLHTTMFFSQNGFRGFDGELAAEGETHPRLCNLTTSATSTIEGEPWLMWHLFDYITDHTVALPYKARFALLEQRVAELSVDAPVLANHIRVMPTVIVTTMAELEIVKQRHIDAGYEGSCLRDPNGMYKEGRSTAREGGLLRIKEFVEEDAVVIRVEEGQTNMNEATINGLGQTERSTHQANMIPNGMLGAMICRDLKTGQEITVAAGCMTHEERLRYFKNQALILGQTIKYKHFLKGRKDKPRFPTFQSIRSLEDQV